MSTEAGPLVDSYRRDAQQRLAAYRELAAKIEKLAVTARSADGSVEVTVGAGGAVSGLTLTEDALRHGAAGLADLIGATVRQAHAKLATRLARRARAYLGDRYDMVGVVSGRLPKVGRPGGGP